MGVISLPQFKHIGRGKVIAMRIGGRVGHVGGPPVRSRKSCHHVAEPLGQYTIAIQVKWIDKQRLAHTMSSATGVYIDTFLLALVAPVAPDFSQMMPGLSIALLDARETSNMCMQYDTIPCTLGTLSPRSSGLAVFQPWVAGNQIRRLQPRNPPRKQTLIKNQHIRDFFFRYKSPGKLDSISVQ